MQELNQALLTLRIEFRAAQDQNQDLQRELSSLQQQITHLSDGSERKGEKIQNTE